MHRPGADQGLDRGLAKASLPFITVYAWHFIHVYCEAQGKGRAKGRLRKVTQWSFIDHRLSIIYGFSLELTLNLVESI